MNGAQAGTRPLLVVLLSLLHAACGGREPPTPGDRIAGAYVADREHYHEVLLTEFRMKEGREPDEPELAFFTLHAESLEIDFRLNRGRTWTLKGLMSGTHTLDEAGTWTLNGDEISLRFTRRQGKPAGGAVTVRIDEHGALLLQLSPDYPGPFRLVRQ